MTDAKSLDQVKSVSDKLAAVAGHKFTFYKIGNRTLRDEKYKTVIYTPAEMTEAQKQNLTAEDKEKCLIVVWSDYGGSYRFYEVNSAPDNLYPFWNATFGKVPEFRVDKDLKYKIVTDENTASIVKSY